MSKKCAYKYCKNPEIQNENEMIRDNGKCYHFACYEKKTIKNEVFLAFCNYVTNEESGIFIRKKISDYVDKENYNANYVLFTMNYIIKNQIPLRSIWGLKKVMDRDKVKQLYEQTLNKLRPVNVPKEEKTFKFEREEKGGWQDLIG